MALSPLRRCRDAVLCAVAAVILVGASPVPVFADPGDGDVPDHGARPEGDVGVAGSDPVPEAGEGPAVGPGITRGPYATRIGEMAKNVAELGQRTVAAESEAELRRGQVGTAYQSWEESASDAAELADLAADLAAEAYQDATAAEVDLFAEYQELFELHPDLVYDDADDVRERATSAATSAATARASLDAARTSAAIAEGTYETLAEQLEEDNAELEDLIAENALAVELEEQRSQIDNRHDAGDIGKDVDDSDADPAAHAAVEFALGQLGKPYEWGAVGPDAYDCSGLVQTAYGEQSVELPRVASDQFQDTRDRGVEIEQMLPGDLIFYGDREGDWASVYHVGMYIGDGEMVHAPRPGDVVKVEPVWFADFFGAHRVVPAAETPGEVSAPAEAADAAEPAPEADVDSQPASEPAVEPRSNSPQTPGSPNETPAPEATPTP